GHGFESHRRLGTICRYFLASRRPSSALIFWPQAGCRRGASGRTPPLSPSRRGQLLASLPYLLLRTDTIVSLQFPHHVRVGRECHRRGMAKLVGYVCDVADLVDQKRRVSIDSRRAGGRTFAT